MQKADDKCFYVLTLRGDLGPFDRATLLEQLQSGAVQATDQVRNAFGRTQGTVKEALDLPRDRPSGALRRPKSPETGRTGSGRTAARGSQTGRRVPPPPPRRRMLPVLVIAGALLLLLVVATVIAGARPSEEAMRPSSASMAPKPRPETSASLATPVAHAPVAGSASPPPAAPRLVIVKAFYGVLPNGPGKDVTANVRSAIKDDRLSFRADNGRFGDPAYMARKDLQVVYTWDGVERSKTVPEDSQMTISDQGR